MLSIHTKIDELMTLDDLELYKFEFSENFSGFHSDAQTAKRMKTDRQAGIVSDSVVSTSIELEQFLACFRVVPGTAAVRRRRRR